MSLKPRIALLSVFVSAGLLVAPAAQAAETAGTTVDGRTVDPRPSTAKLAFELHKLALLSHGKIRVDKIGRSNEGRPVWAARVGHGKTRIQYVTQQHGDEPLGTPAALEFLRQVGVGHSPWAQKLLSKVTVDIVVRANPDGNERDWRYNYDPDATPEYGEKGKGYDINRYHDPAVAPKDNPATEAGLIQRRNASFKPDIMVDYHMQGRYKDANGREITASTLWPTNAGVKQSDVDFAKQIAVVVQRSIDGNGGYVSQYPGGGYQGIARNGYGLLGNGSVLIELSLIPEREQAQIQDALASMLAIAKTAADGSVRKVDPAKADAIPPRGPALPGTVEEAHEAA
ncbi:M14 family zinc carboxypeptidase [Amycolatopsis sp. BJA-103]|uniref:M14 family zinc carboxypeptidase n=1 Tax=Amycolatopsis sp. BJA-103 TaxID=1911175 RepID=UPI000C76C83D|nr:M14 family zinc carboxypeptidase [Amycolatopsis sp. BJA-103]AUI57121.1 peptidase M14 [Amycolatopsis sp. BJA-103]PNE15398.1 peptidase M14 [Amycolatopsis sp. BJA-103]